MNPDRYDACRGGTHHLTSSDPLPCSIPLHEERSADTCNVVQSSRESMLGL